MGDNIDIQNKAVDGFNYIKLEAGNYITAEAGEEIQSFTDIPYMDSKDSIIESVEKESSSDFIGTETYTTKPHESNTYWAGADGHEITLINNKNARDPNYSELVSFLKLDKTDEIGYNYETFVCADFAEAVHNNAEAAGYNCAWVSTDFEKGGGHACNAFNTTDKGLIFIDSTKGFGSGYNKNWDTIANIEKGKIYHTRSLSNSRTRYDSMGTVIDYKIYR